VELIFNFVQFGVWNLILCVAYFVLHRPLLRPTRPRDRSHFPCAALALLAAFPNILLGASPPIEKINILIKIVIFG
jgi:hypothetical protein